MLVSERATTLLLDRAHHGYVGTVPSYTVIPLPSALPMWMLKTGTWIPVNRVPEPDDRILTGSIAFIVSQQNRQETGV